MATYLYPGVKNIVFRLNGVNVHAIVQMIDCYYDNRRRIKHLIQVKHLLRKCSLQWLAELYSRRCVFVVSWK